ncbi:MAG: sulfatase [Planctomycetaceae bacterium]|nr:sulfatase [Planctomycetaceae bacterium]
MFLANHHDLSLRVTRRHFFGASGGALGAAALGSLLGPLRASGAASSGDSAADYLLPGGAKAKRIIFLFQSGGPSQVDLFDYKPLLNQRHGEQLPDSVRAGQRLTGMSAQQSSIPLAGSPFEFAQHGESGAWLSELLPHHRKIVDELCIVKSMFTEAINHDPAITFFQTGSQIAGRPSLGAWLSYGLGSPNDNLPAFIVLVSAGQQGQPLYARLWGSGFLDSRYQGVQFRAGRDPVLYLSNPDGVCRSGRRAMLDKLGELNRAQFEAELDPEIESRIAQYEMAFRMQTSVPEATDLTAEPDSTFALYGEDARQPGTFAANCLLARRLAERGVPFIQLYHQGWDQHGSLAGEIRKQCAETDQASAALVLDLKQRGLLEDTLVVWGGEFGRTSYSQGLLTPEGFGRDHHPRCFTMWMAGGGVRGGTTYGATDDFGYNIVDAAGAPLQPTKHEFTPGAVHVHDLQATLLHLLGVDHQRLAFKYQGRRFRLTDVHGHVVRELLA